MRIPLTTTPWTWLVAGALLLTPGRLAATAATVQVGTPSGHQRPMHATRGVVMEIDADRIVITRFSNRGAIVFRLTPSTSREGIVTVGAKVSVRYVEEGADRVATAVAPTRIKD